jgi:tRNA(Arg) A34 adenosine deaminase TadA
MCAAASIWAGISRIVYGVSIPWLAVQGWTQIRLRAAEVVQCASNPPDLHGGVLADECAALFLAARTTP